LEIDLNTMSLKDLRDLQSQVAKAIASFEERRKKEALLELEEKAKTLGFTLAELTGAAAKRKRAPAAPKYANPAEPSETWSGRGRKPKWFLDALASGSSPDDLAI
jgi:DNA-binding protein H-NS